MPAPLRFIPEEAKLWTDQKGRPIAIAEVTIRTIQGRYLMKPTLRPLLHPHPKSTRPRKVAPDFEIVRSGTI